MEQAKIVLAIDNIGIYTSYSNGNSSSSSGMRLNISQLKLGYECTNSTMVNNSSVQSYANAGINALTFIYAFGYEYAFEILGQEGHYVPCPT